VHISSSKQLQVLVNWHVLEYHHLEEEYGLTKLDKDDKNIFAS